MSGRRNTNKKIRVWGRRGRHRLILNTPYADEFEEVLVMLIVYYIWCLVERSATLLSFWDSGRKPFKWRGLALTQGGLEWISRGRDYLIVPNSTNLAWSASSHRISYISLVFTEVGLIESLSVRSAAAAAAAAAKSLQMCLTLCDPIDGSPPGSPSLGFSRQEHWSGLPFPSPMHKSEKWKWSHSVMSNS